MGYNPHPRYFNIQLLDWAGIWPISKFGDSSYAVISFSDTVPINGL